MFFAHPQLQHCTGDTADHPKCVNEGGQKATIFHMEIIHLQLHLGD